MITKAFSIWDSKASCYGTPFFMPQNGMALRAFGDLVADGNSTVSKHPSDYLLYMVGEFDDQLAEFKTQVPPVLLANGSEYVPVKAPLTLALNGAESKVEA